MTPVSAVLIVKDEPLLVDAIASIRPFVAEVCILDGSTDPDRRAEAERLADRYARQEGPANDWSALREAAMALASHDAVLWLDADDVVEGLEHLQDALRERSSSIGCAVRITCPYEYAYDRETGECAMLQVRERIVYPKSGFRWEGPAHETLVAKDGASIVNRHEPRIVWKHGRATDSSSGRALRVLEAHVAKYGVTSLRVLLDLGLELAAVGRCDEAIASLRAYVEQSDRGCDLARAAMTLAQLEGSVADLTLTIAWLERAVHEFAPHAPAPKIALARALLAQALLSGDPTGADRVTALLVAAQSNVESGTDIYTPRSPKDEAEIFELLVAAHNLSGDLEAAGDAIQAWLRTQQNNPRAVLAWRDHTGARFFPSALDIAIVCGHTPETWTPASIAREGIGGSETAVVAMARELAHRGHRVRVFNDCGRAGIYDGVEYREVHEIEDVESVDVLVAWRVAPLLDTIHARVKVIWTHDVIVQGFTHESGLRADRVLALSAWHKAHLVKTHRLHPGHVAVTRNGIDLDRFTDVHQRRDPHCAIYSSSPDRGLALLLDVWPEIREEIPDAELVVAYGFEGWERAAARTGDQHHRYLIESMKRRMRETPGVDFVGRVDQKQLARMMCSVGVWTLPGWFDETSCIGAMEAQAAGCRIVASRRAALIETVGQNGMLIDGDWLSQDYRTAYIDAMVEALRDDGIAKRAAAQNVARDRFAWSAVADEWVTMFRELLVDADAAILPPYCPAVAA